MIDVKMRLHLVQTLLVILLHCTLIEAQTGTVSVIIVQEICQLFYSNVDISSLLSCLTDNWEDFFPPGMKLCHCRNYVLCIIVSGWWTEKKKLCHQAFRRN